MLQACTSTKIKEDKKKFVYEFNLDESLKVNKIEKKIKKCFDPISILHVFFCDRARMATWTMIGWTVYSRIQF